MTVEVFRITKPEEIELPGVGEFLRLAIATNTLVRDVEAAIDELKTLAPLPITGLYIVNADGKWTGMAFCMLDYSAFSRACLIVHCYTGAHAPTRRALMQTAADFARGGGMDRIYGFDINDSPEAFQRLFRAVGKPIKSGIVVVFDTTAGLL